MEGDFCPLPALIRLKRKYKAYLYVDEAHSIGVVGRTGRGIVDHFGCDINDIDILMGTFTNSFASAGCFIAGSHSLITYLKHSSHANFYASSMCMIVCNKILYVLNDLLTNNMVKRRLDNLKENTFYFREKLKRLGFCVSGDNESPVVSCLIRMPSKNM
jgi:serine palmitoyltransferase